MARKKETYEDMMSRLEGIVDLMDNNELSLEDAMKKYEEGITLCNGLYKVLNEAEQKIKILSNTEEINFVRNEE